jgi:hypothetical protein
MDRSMGLLPISAIPPPLKGVGDMSLHVNGTKVMPGTVMVKKPAEAVVALGRIRLGKWDQ